jgi:hypothetical protein
MGSLKVEDPFWAARLPRWVVTTNPGNIGHEYIKKIFIDPSPPGTEFIDEQGVKTIWIPAFITDNPHLDAEEYKKQIRSTGDTTLISQLLDGNWDLMNNSFFGDAFKRAKNVVPDFKVPKEWGNGYRNYDPGYSSPFGYVLVFRVKGHNHVTTYNGEELYFPNDSFVVYREWYGYDGKDINVGLRWTHAEIAEVMRAKEEEWGFKGRVQAGRADWKIWDGELNVYSEYESRGLRFVKADKHKGSRASGALRMRQLLFAAHQEPLEKPALFFVDKCIHCIATIPTLPTDDSGCDVVTEGVPDHLYDCLRYFIASKQQVIGTMQVTGL